MFRMSPSKKSREATAMILLVHAVELRVRADIFHVTTSIIYADPVPERK